VRRFLSALVAIPVAIVLVLFAVANRAPVVLSLDPFAPEAPALAFQLPLFVVVFLALMAGVVVGGVADWLRQGRYRQEARARRSEVRRLEAERERMKAVAPSGAHLPTVTGLPAIRR
jgi:uncharacterized integral membrane protein